MFFNFFLIALRFVDVKLFSSGNGILYHFYANIEKWEMAQNVYVDLNTQFDFAFVPHAKLWCCAIIFYKEMQIFLLSGKSNFFSVWVAID